LDKFINLERDVLARMDFRPAMATPPATIGVEHFEALDRRAG
jgi:hypothetical protein